MIHTFFQNFAGEEEVKVPGCQGATQCQGATRCQRATRYQGARVPRCQGARVPRCRAVPQCDAGAEATRCQRWPRCHRARVRRSAKVPRCHGATQCHFPDALPATADCSDPLAHSLAREVADHPRRHSHLGTWHPGTPALRHSGTPATQHLGTVVPGTLALWHFGTPAPRHLLPPPVLRGRFVSSAARRVQFRDQWSET